MHVENVCAQRREICGGSPMMPLDPAMVRILVLDDEPFIAQSSQPHAEPAGL